MPAKAPSRIKPPDVQGAVLAMEAARARGRGRRSPLYLWFADNYAALVAALERNAPAWAELAAYLGKHGLRDADGKVPTTRATRDAWYRVRRDKAAAAARKASKAAAVARGSGEAAASGLIPAPPAAEAPQPKSADVQDILGRLGGTRSRGSRLPNSVE